MEPGVHGGLGDLISLLQLTPLFAYLEYMATGDTFLQTLDRIEPSQRVHTGSQSLLSFWGLPHLNQQGDPITYLVFPPLTWAALRFGPRGATAAFTAFSGFCHCWDRSGVFPHSPQAA